MRSDLASGSLPTYTRLKQQVEFLPRQGPNSTRASLYLNKHIITSHKAATCAGVGQGRGSDHKTGTSLHGLLSPSLSPSFPSSSSFPLLHLSVLTKLFLLLYPSFLTIFYPLSFIHSFTSLLSHNALLTSLLHSCSFNLPYF